MNEPVLSENASASARPLILLIEDDPQIQNLTGYILRQSDYRLLQAKSANEALGLLSERQPDLILLDLGLPYLDGQELLRVIRKQSDIPVIILSARHQEEQKVAALDAGADDYLTKPFYAAELLARIRTAFRHAAKSGSEPSVLSLPHLSLNLSDHTLKSGKRTARLTPLEFVLMKTLMEHAGAAVTVRQLMEAVYQTSDTSDTQALRSLMASLRRKVEENPARPQFIQTEIGVGYRLTD